MIGGKNPTVITHYYVGRRVSAPTYLIVWYQIILRKSMLPILNYLQEQLEYQATNKLQSKLSLLVVCLILLCHI